MSSSSDTLSPPPSSPTHTTSALDLPQDIYYDPRTLPGPSLYVKAVVNHSGNGSVLARSVDGLHCAVACKDNLKVVKINALPFNGPSSRRSKLLGKGPEGATIHEETTIRMTQNTLITDVGWGHGTFSNKLVVTSMSGDIIIADFGKSKVERTIKEHTRSVNGLAFAPHLQNWFATCGQDGYVKLWDMRTQNLEESSISINHRISTRCIAFSPQQSSPWHAVVALESGAFYKWDYRKGSVGLLDRFTAAHAGAILGMEWVGPGSSDSQGWLCTGGMDKTVKIWDMSIKLQDSKPAHVLHTAEKVKRVAWRPGYDCEVAVVPMTPGLSARAGSDRDSTSDADRIEIWDVRRPWVPKYVLERGEGAVVDIIWAGPDALWATYGNGTLVQHDLRDCSRPLDSIPRSALAWEASGSITYANDAVTAWDQPYDDVKPPVKPQLVDRGWKDKTPSDPDYIPASQTVATVTLPVFDLQGFVDLARGYRFAPNPHLDPSEKAETLQDVCLLNATVAHQAEYYRASQTWLTLHSLLSPLVPPPVSQDNADVSGLASPGTRASSTHTSQAAPQSLNRPLYRPPERRTVSAGGIHFSNALPPTPTAARLTHSSENSPASENRRSYSALPSSSPFAKPTPSRRSSIATKFSRTSITRRKGSGSQDRRSRSRTRGRSESVDSQGQSRASSRAISRHLGDGALDDPSSEEDENYDSPIDIDASGATRPSRSGFGHSAKSSLASNTLEVPNEADEHALPRGWRSGLGSPSGAIPPPQFEEHSDDAGALGDDNYTSSSSSTGRDSPHAPPSSPIVASMLSLERPKITKQDSKSSIRTEVPSQPDKSRLSVARRAGPTPYASSGGDTEGRTRPSHMAVLESSTDGEFGGSTRRPSPAVSGSERRHIRNESFVGVSVKPTEDVILEVNSPHLRSHRLNSSSTSPHPSTEHTPLVRDSASLLGMDRISSYGTAGKPKTAVADTAAGSDHEEDGRGRTLRRTRLPPDPVRIMEEELEIRRVGWAAMKEAFDYYLEKGDVQMCTALATIARGGLLTEDDRGVLDRLSYSYVDLLSRLRLHTSAAYVRKHGASQELKASTNVDTIVYTACGRCRKPILKAAGAPPTLGIPPLAGALHQRGPSFGNRSRQGSIGQRRSHSRGHSTTFGGLGIDTKANQLVEGGFGYCSSCKEATARCSICRLPVRGLHFYCPTCSHGGHHECYRLYYLRRPMVPLPAKDVTHAEGTPGAPGWGLAAMIRPPEKESDGGLETPRSDRRDSDPSEPEKVAGKERGREGSIVSVGLTTVASMSLAGLGIGVGGGPKDRTAVKEPVEKEKDRERDRPKEWTREREPAKKLMGHPCAAGCGHLCWTANDLATGPN